GRALALVAPETPKRRKEQAPPAERQALAGEDEPAELTPAQRAAVERIVAGGGPYLLYGPTGSGKTEVYLQACAAMLVRGLGVIVVDEEHDASYKQDSDPRYDARTVAAKRAALEGAVAVYGSATPRPESWSSLERLELGARLGAALPPVRIVDLRREAG